MSPGDVNASEIWEVAAALGRNDVEEREPWPDGAPDIRTLRRALAFQEGRDYDRDSPISDDEYEQLLEMARAGKRQEMHA